jgi:hypothetical protein
MRGAGQRPVTSHNQGFLSLYNLEDWKPRGTFLVFTCCRNRCPIGYQNFSCLLEISLPVKLIYLLRVHRFVITSAHISQHCNLLTSNYNKPAHSTPKESRYWSLEYQFLSVQHEPLPASLSNQPLGQHRRTWPIPSYSGYNNIPGGNGGRYVRLTTSPLSCAECHENLGA